ncbi:MAG: transposase family protein, partial [Desulfobulbaceae bacterium]|nr:transposase family protein [Desulfobulbaceae bacterium]
SILTPYFNHSDELTSHDGLVFRGERVVIPRTLISKMCERVHSSHIGIEGCLRRARECLFWPNMNSDLKEYMSQCSICLSLDSTSQQKETLMSHELPLRPWEKVGVDLFELDNKDYLITVDYYSNFWEVDRLYKTSSNAVISKLKNHFARYGIPDKVMSENGPQFDSQTFSNFAREWDFDHLTSSPGHSQSNGKAESAVKTAKRLIRKANKAGSDIYLAILDYRNTPNQVTSNSPVQSLLMRRTKTLLPTTSNLLKPSVTQVRDKLKLSQARQALHFNKGAKDLSPLEEGDMVGMKPFKKAPWRPATIVRCLDKCSYEVCAVGTTYRRNRVQLRQTQEKPSTPAPQ